MPKPGEKPVEKPKEETPIRSLPNPTFQPPQQIKAPPPQASLIDMDDMVQPAKPAATLWNTPFQKANEPVVQQQQQPQNSNNNNICNFYRFYLIISLIYLIPRAIQCS